MATGAEYYAAYQELGAIRAVARKFNVHRTTVREAVARFEHREGVRADLDPGIIESAAAAGINDAAKLDYGWVKADSGSFHFTNPKFNGVADDWLDRVTDAFKEIERAKPVEAPKAVPTSLVNHLVFSDAHIGGMAWEPETGASWDLKIAERCLKQCYEALVSQMQPAATCVLTILGDWMHYDKMEQMTTLSGHILDGDGRQPKMAEVAVAVLRHLIQRALKTHDKVVLIIAEGNHDLISSGWLRRMFALYFEDEPRIEIIDDPRPFYAVLIDDVLLGIHHGHLKSVGFKKAQAIKNAEQLVAIFADEYRELWGQAKKVYVHTGHLHGHVRIPVRGADVIQHPTIASRDSYAARHGWSNMRKVIGTTYHGKFGEKAEVTVSPEMLENA